MSEQILIRFKDECRTLLRIKMNRNINLCDNYQERVDILQRLEYYHKTDPKLRNATWANWKTVEENLDQIIIFTGVNSHQLFKLSKNILQFDYRTTRVII